MASHARHRGARDSRRSPPQPLAGRPSLAQLALRRRPSAASSTSRLLGTPRQRAPCLATGHHPRPLPRRFGRPPACRVGPTTSPCRRPGCGRSAHSLTTARLTFDSCRGGGPRPPPFASGGKKEYGLEGSVSGFGFGSASSPAPQRQDPCTAAIGSAAPPSYHCATAACRPRSPNTLSPIAAAVGLRHAGCCAPVPPSSSGSLPAGLGTRPGGGHAPAAPAVPCKPCVCRSGRPRRPPPRPTSPLLPRPCVGRLPSHAWARLPWRAKPPTAHGLGKSGEMEGARCRLVLSSRCVVSHSSPPRHSQRLRRHHPDLHAHLCLGAQAGVPDRSGTVALLASTTQSPGPAAGAAGPTTFRHVPCYSASASGCCCFGAASWPSPGRPIVAVASIGPPRRWPVLRRLPRLSPHCVAPLSFMSAGAGPQDSVPPLGCSRCA
jgi:hypothetical protein